MNDTDTIPVKESRRELLEKLLKEEISNVDVLSQKANKERAIVHRLPREDLEDRYLKLYDENIILRKHAWKQEEKIKKLAAKLIKVIEDQKKGIPASAKVDITKEQLVNDMQQRIVELERENSRQREQLLIIRRRSTLEERLGGGSRTFAQARVDSGVARPPAEPRAPATAWPDRPKSPQRYGQSLLEDTRAENKRLESVIVQLQEQLATNEADMEFLKNEMQSKQDDIQRQLNEGRKQQNSQLKSQVEENVELVKLQRDISEKQAKMAQLQTQYTAMEAKVQIMAAREEGIERDAARLKEQLRDAQNRLLDMKLQLDTKALGDQQQAHMQAQLDAAAKENQILKESNQKLIESAFDLEREREWRERETALKVQVAQLEAALKADVGEKGSVLDKLTEERKKADVTQKELSEFRTRFFEQKQQLETLQDKMALFTGNDGLIKRDELEEALVLVRTRRAAAERSGADEQVEAAAVNVEQFTQRISNVQKQLRLSEAQLADCAQELDKTRSLLAVQYRINKHYEEKLRLERLKADEERRALNEKLDELARGLDARQVRIEQLGKQLQDVAYGTRQYRLADVDDLAAGRPLGQPTEVRLQRGENLLEFHLVRVVLSADALARLRAAGSSERLPAAMMFCTMEFYDFELETTPVVAVPTDGDQSQIEYNFVAEYIMRVDDALLRHLSADFLTVEFHQSFGTDYRTLATARVSFKELLTKPNGAVHCECQLVGIKEAVGVNFGVIQFWAKLRIPLEQSFMLHVERLRALGHLGSAKAAPAVATVATNVLRVVVVRARLAKLDRPPSLYGVYKFADFADHCTPIVNAAPAADFNDAATFAVTPSAELDRYFTATKLPFYFFDDRLPPDDQSSYVGVALVPLVTLTKQTDWQASFEIMNRNDQSVGTIDLLFQWLADYQPSAGQPLTPPAAPEPPEDLLEKEARDIYSEQLQDILRNPSATMPELASAGSSSKPVRLSTITERSETGAARSTMGANSVIGAATAEDDRLVAQELQDTMFEEPASALSDADKDDDDVVIAEEKKYVDDDLEPESVEHRAETTAKRLSPIGLSVAPGETTRDDSWSESESVGGAAGHAAPAHRDADEDVGALTEDSEGVVSVSPARPPNPDVVHVAVNSLALEPDCAPMHDANVQRLYVAYRFLDFAPEQLETPYSLPKPRAGQKVHFNFTKAFHVDAEKNGKSRQLLAAMLKPEHEDQGCIEFSVVSEPVDDTGDAECEDIGSAFVSFPNVLAEGRDPIARDFPIFSQADGQTAVGQLNLTINCVEALRRIPNSEQLARPATLGALPAS